jgi:signal transduction histidine kinase
MLDAQGFESAGRHVQHVAVAADLIAVLHPVGDLGPPRPDARAQVEEQALSVVVDVDPPDLTLTADPALIDQVLVNLALNAVQAVENQEEGRIELRAHVDRRSHPVIRVEDNGPGIPPDVQEKIFVPFFTTKEDGSGIGLSLSRRIMRLYGGSLSVRSSPEAGTTFTLRF